jgi:hypothetical protein
MAATLATKAETILEFIHGLRGSLRLKSASVQFSVLFALWFSIAFRLQVAGCKSLKWEKGKSLIRLCSD